MCAASISAGNARLLRVIFARHGESTANIDGVFANRPGSGGDLTPRGIDQARDLANKLSRSGVNYVYTSPLARALQTATIAGDILDTPVTIHDGLREYDVGDYEGLPYTGPHAWRMTRYDEIEAAWRHGHRDAAHPGGECLNDLEARVRAFLDDVDHHHRVGETILAIGHGGLFRVILPSLFPETRQELIALGFDYVTTITAEHRHGGWACAQRR